LCTTENCKPPKNFIPVPSVLNLICIRFKPQDGQYDRRIESVLSDFDGKSAEAIRNLATLKPRNPPDPDTLARLAVFAALQRVRVPMNDTYMRAVYSTGGNDLMEVMSSNVEGMRASLRRYEREKGEKLNVSAESMIEAVKSGHYKAIATEIPFLRSIGEHPGFIAKALADLKLQILISPPEVGFILTDNPFTTVPAPGDRMVGIVNLGTFTYIPVTRGVCLRYGITGRNEFRMLDRDDVRLINQNFAINSERFIMGPSQIQLQSVVRRSGSATIDPSPRFSIEKSFDTDGSIVRQLRQLPRRRYFHQDL
jgi:hypothetical protein